MISSGPFKIGQEYDNRRDEIEDAKGRCVAVVWTRRAIPGATAREQFKDCPEGNANARLFAASHDLLFACRMAEKFVSEIRQTGKLPPVAVGVSMHDVLDAAIAKAKGGVE